MKKNKFKDNLFLANGSICCLVRRLVLPTLSHVEAKFSVKIICTSLRGNVGEAVLLSCKFGRIFEKFALPC